MKIKSGDGLITYERALKFETEKYKNENEDEKTKYIFIFKIRGYYHTIGDKGKDYYCISFDTYTENVYPYTGNY